MNPPLPAANLLVFHKLLGLFARNQGILVSQPLNSCRFWRRGFCAVARREDEEYRRLYSTDERQSHATKDQVKTRKN